MFMRLSELRRHAADRTSAHGDDHVAVLCDAPDSRLHLADVLDEDRLDLAGEAQRASERPSAATIGASPAGYTSPRSSTSTSDSTRTKSRKGRACA